MEQTRQFLPGFDRRQRLCLMCPGRYEYEQPIERNEGHTTLYGNSKFLIGRMSLIFIDQHQVESDYKLMLPKSFSLSSCPLHHPHNRLPLSLELVEDGIRVLKARDGLLVAFLNLSCTCVDKQQPSHPKQRNNIP